MVTADAARGRVVKCGLLPSGWLWVCLLLAGPCFAADSPAEGRDAEGAAPVAADAGPSATSDPDVVAKKHALSLGFVMLGCLIVGGALLLVLVVIWGNRTRRLARSPLPPISKRDELWFLKPRKPDGGDVESGDGPGTEPEIQ